MTDDEKLQNARAGRQAALVMVVSALLSVFAPAIVTGLGLPPRYVILLSLFALAGFIWALVVTYKLWQKTREK